MPRPRSPSAPSLVLFALRGPARQGNKLLWGYDPRQDGELRAAFTQAARGGVRFFDTGDSYGTGSLKGRAEVLLGDFRQELARTRPREARALCFGTKLAVYPWRLTSQSFVDAARASLARMGLEQIEIVQAHWSAQRFQPWQERPLWEGLADCYDLGLCRAVGLSNFGPKQLALCAEYMGSRGVPIALNQVRGPSLWAPPSGCRSAAARTQHCSPPPPPIPRTQVQLSLLSTRPLDTGLLSLCAELRIKPVAYSPLALGALSGKYSPDALPKGPRGLVIKQVLSGARELTATIDEVCRARKKTPAQVALNWAMCKGAVPIVGCRSVAQVEDNLAACSFTLTGAEVAELEHAARRVKQPATQNVFMTD